MTEWKTYRLGEIVATNKKSIGRSYPFSMIKYLDTGSITRNHIESLQEYKLSEAPSRAKRLVQDGDIIYSAVRPNQLHYGYISKFPENLVVSTGFIVISCNKDYIEPKFLYYLLTQQEMTDYLHSIADASTSAYPSLKSSDIENLEISLPGLAEQRRIAGILGAIDDKIENNRRINANLESQSQALYKQWFVDSSTVKLGDVVKTTSGGTPSRSHMEFYVGKYGWVKSKELNSSFITKTEETITDDAIAKSAAKLLPAKSILIAMYGATVGQYAILSQPMTCNQAVCALLPNENYPYTYLFMVAKNIKEELANKAIGSAQQNISQVIIKDIDISSDIEKIKQFHKIVCPHFEVMEKNQKENETLATLRDTLLPKLMDGEIKTE